VSASAVAEIASAVNGANNNTAATKVNHFEIASDVTPAVVGGVFRELIVTISFMAERYGLRLRADYPYRN